MSEEERQVLDLLEKFEADKQAREGFVFEEGKLEGKIEGKLEGKIETTINMLKLKLPLQTIMLSTGLSEKDIMALKDSRCAT
jgi:predicted transposase/invertase (TIGR01784 family)